jgi:multidrug resistance protein, MATE family
MLGFEEKASMYSQQYIYVYIPAMFFFGQVDINRRFLVNMGCTKAPMFIQLFITILHVGWCYIFIDYLQMGFKGAALAMMISSLLSLIIAYVYTEFRVSKELRDQAWFSPFSKDHMHACFDLVGLKSYYKMGLSCIGMLSLEWWSFEIMMIFAARLGVLESASQIVIMNFNSLCYMFPLGLQISGAVLVGQ